MPFSKIFISGCDPRYHILRVSLYTVNDQDIRDYLEECEIGIKVSESGIGPKIYKVGLIQSNGYYYFYSIVEKLQGYEAGHILSNLARNSKISEFNLILGNCVSVLNSVANKHGYLMMDSKPANVMICRNDKDYKYTKAYVIDFDPQYILKTADVEKKTIYGKINAMFFSVHYHTHFEYGIENVERVFNTEYSNNPDLKIKIKSEIIELYVSNPEFCKICGHYKYNESDLLRGINWLVEYNKIEVGDLYPYFIPVEENNDSLSYFFGFQNNPLSNYITFKYPIIIIKQNSKFEYKSDKSEKSDKYSHKSSVERVSYFVFNTLNNEVTRSRILNNFWSFQGFNFDNIFEYKDPSINEGNKKNSRDLMVNMISHDYNHIRQKVQNIINDNYDPNVILI